MTLSLPIPCYFRVLQVTFTQIVLFSLNNAITIR